MSPAAPKSIAGRPVGPVGYGMMSECPGACVKSLAPRQNMSTHSQLRSESFLSLCSLLTIKKDLTLFGKISQEDGVKPMKTALESGANFWNAVSACSMTFQHSFYFTLYLGFLLWLDTC